MSSGFARAGGTDQRRAARSPAAVLAAGVYLAYFDRAVPGAVAPLVKHDLRLSDTALGFATATAAAIAYAVVAVAMAALDRGGRRRDAALIGGMIVWTIGTAALAFAGTAPLYVAAEMLVGAGQAAFVPAAATAIVGAGGLAGLGGATARFTNASTLGRSSALLVTGLLIAMVAATGVVPPMLPAAWRVVFLLTALPNVIVVVLLAAGLRWSPAAAIAPIDQEPSAATPPVAMLIGCFLVAVAPVMLIQAVGAWYPVLLVRIAALSPARAAMIAGAATLVAAPLGQQIGGRLLDRRPDRRRRPGTTIVPLLGAAGTGLLLLGIAPGRVAAVVVLAGIDLGLGAAAAVGLAGIQALVGAARRGRVNTLFFALVTIVGVGLGPLLAGGLSDLGGATGTALASALAGMAAVALAAAWGGHLLMVRRVGYPGKTAPAD